MVELIAVLRGSPTRCKLCLEVQLSMQVLEFMSLASLHGYSSVSYRSVGSQALATSGLLVLQGGFFLVLLRRITHKAWTLTSDACTFL